MMEAREKTVPKGSNLANFAQRPVEVLSVVELLFGERKKNNMAAIATPPGGWLM